MAANDMIFVRCRFGRAGFAHERVFLITAPGGKGSYRGTAYIEYCLTADEHPLPDGEPPHGKFCEGLLACRQVAGPAGGLVTIEVPDGGVCDVDPAELVEPAHVPLEPRHPVGH